MQTITHTTKQSILVADDDPEDQLLFAEAMRENRAPNSVTFVNDGQELLDHLARQLESREQRFPSLILLDLNMPRLDGREALRRIKSDPRLCHIPIVVFTTSPSNDDVKRSYQNGANSYITKPMSFTDLVSLVELLRRYWFQTVDLPA